MNRKFYHQILRAVPILKCVIDIVLWFWMVVMDLALVKRDNNHHGNSPPLNRLFQYIIVVHFRSVQSIILFWSGGFLSVLWLLFPFECFITLFALERSHLPSVLFHVALQTTWLSTRVIALVTFEWSFPGMGLHVALLMNRTNASAVALVAFERLVSCVLPHNVEFQTSNFGAGIIAHWTSRWLFTRVRILVPSEVAWF